MEGFEPTTPALRKLCSTVELHRLYRTSIYIIVGFVKGCHRQKQTGHGEKVNLEYIRLNDINVRDC